MNGTIRDTRIIAEKIKQHGNAASIALFDPRLHLFSAPDGEGFVGYRSLSKYNIVLGEPVCETARMPSLITAFHDHSQEQKKKVIYVPVSSHFLDQVCAHHTACSLQIGDEIVLSPVRNIHEDTGADARRLRNKVNQAVRDKITLKEYTDNDVLREAAFERLKREWLLSRTGPQVFQQPIEVFGERSHKRWFYAEQHGIILGLIILNKIKRGWVLNISMINKDAPRYLSEVLILHILDTLRTEQCNELTIGTVPAAQLGSLEGMGIMSQKIARMSYKMAKKLFNLGNGHKFWKKFEPHIQPMYVICSGSKVTLSQVTALIRAFNAHF